MNNSPTKSLIDDFSQKLINKFGLNFERARRNDLEFALNESSNLLNIPISELIRNITQNYHGKHFNTFLDSLKISETYFFREKQTLELAGNLSKNRIIEEKLKIWVAGCSTGEEVYSIVIELLEKYGNDLNFHIYASDVNNNSLTNAKKALYGNWSFRNMGPDILEKYFDRIDNKYRAKSFIKKHVSFQYHNLINSPYPSVLNNTSDLDFIFCRNVLLYFNKKSRDIIINKFYNCLKNKGILFLGLTETSFVRDKNFKRVFWNETLYFEKTAPDTKRRDNEARSQYKTEQANNKGVIPATEFKDLDNFIDTIRDKYNDRNYQECLEEIKELRDLNNFSQLSDDHKKEITVYYIYSLMNMGNYESARIECETAITTKKDVPKFYLILANLFVHSGDYNNAIINIRKAIYLKPEGIASNILLGRLLKIQGDENKSRKQFEYVCSLLKKLPKDQIVEDTDGFSVSSLENMINDIIKN